MARAVRRALRNGGLAVRAVADATIRSEAGEAERRSIQCTLFNGEASMPAFCSSFCRLVGFFSCWLLGRLASWLLVACSSVLASQSQHTYLLFCRSTQSACDDALKSERLRLFRR